MYTLLTRLVQAHLRHVLTATDLALHPVLSDLDAAESFRASGESTNARGSIDAFISRPGGPDTKHSRGRGQDHRLLVTQTQCGNCERDFLGNVANQSARPTDYSENPFAPVRARSAEVDLQLLHTMLRWAVTVRTPPGKRFLDQNPLVGVKRPKERNPKRPVPTWERFQATRRIIHELGEKATTEASSRKWLKLETR